MNLDKRRVSPKELAAAGWTRRPPGPRDLGKFGTDFFHRDGWCIEHCGHPTALWPYLLIDPEGGIVLQGAIGPLRNPTYGTAWATVAWAVEYVATVGLNRRELLEVCGWSRPERKEDFDA